MLAAIVNVFEYAMGLNFDDFESNAMIHHAVSYNIVIIGETADLLTEEFQNEHPDTPWRKMKGMRNFLVYDYQVESDIVWAVITNDLPLLHRQLQTYLK